MTRFSRCLAAAGAGILLTALSATAAQAAPPNVPQKHSHNACTAAPAGSASCHAKVVDDASTGKPVAAAAPQPGSYGPADLRSAYALTATGSASQTIAIVDAFDDPNAESDLAVYRAQYGLPACTTANGCFRKVNQTGGTKAPRADAGWAQEISLDIDMASAICPNCHILLVEATSSSFSNLGTAENTAARLGATVISNSYGGSEFSTETSADAQYFNHPGIPMTVSSGDSGFGVEYPAASKNVTAVGGTTLTRTTSTTRGWTETVWSGAGSGCSAYEAKPAWQHDTGCARRTVADVAAVADPNTGVAVYDTYGAGSTGWLVFGGTSVAAPVVAGVYALAANGAAPSFPYAHTASLFDVTSGSNGTCSPAYLCTGGTGYDGPTGLGTPNGTAAF